MRPMPKGIAPAPTSVELAMIDLIKSAMERRGQTNSGLARATGISRPQLVDYLAGRKSMRVGELVAVCDALALDLASLAVEAEQNAQPHP